MPTLEEEAKQKNVRIEERVDTGLSELLASYNPNYIPGEQPDILRDRYQILPGEPLAQYNHKLAEAFAARDLSQTNRSGYALVLKNNLPYRIKAADALSSTNNENIQTVMGAGTVMLSHLEEARHVVFLESLEAPTLADIRKSGVTLHEHAVVDKILVPLSNALQTFKSRGIVHGTINTHTVHYDNDTVILRECISAPCGYYQDYLYEPIERLMANDNGRGYGDMKADIYATGVLVFEMIFGLDHLRSMTKPALIEAIAARGTYQVFVKGRELSDSFADFFRGVLCDARSERWDFEQLSAWIAGKRYNIVVPPTPKKATRALVFLGKEFYSRRAVAHAFHQNWRTSIKEMFNLRVDRWIEVSMHRTDLADRIERIMRSGGSASSERTNNEMMIRLISILDPSAPLRTPFVSVRPEGMGLFLLESLQNDMQTEVQEIRHLIEADMPNYWSLLTDEAKPSFLSKILWVLSKQRQYIGLNAMGFGIERTIYDLNPSLPCQSDLVKTYNPMNLEELLRALDAVAPAKAKNQSFVDRHIAAYCMSKMDAGKEIRVSDLAAIPALTKNNELIVLRILARAQQRYDKLQLKGLATWAAMRVELMLDQIHNRTIRKKLKLKLKAAASTGYLHEVLSVLINRDIVNKDFEGFGRAALLFARNRTNIEQLKNPKYIDKSARDMGGRVATMLAYMGLVGSAYFVIADIMRW